MRARARSCTGLWIALASGPAVTTATAGSPDAQPHASGRSLASQVNDPTAPLRLVQFRNVLAPRVPGADGAANLFEIQPVLPVGASERVPFEQLIKITLPVGTTPDPDRTTGLGDLQVFDLAAIPQSWGRWGLGVALVFPTAASDELGQGKWQAGPAAAVIVTAVKGLQAGAVLQNPISFAGSSRRESVSALSITPTLTYNLPSGWFGGYSDFDWIFDWRNGGEATIPLGLQAGKAFTVGQVPLSLSFEAAYNVARPDETPRWLLGIEFNWVLPSRSKAR